MIDKDAMYRIASFMVADPHEMNAIKTFTRFLKDCITRNQLGSPLSKQWLAAVNEYVDRISNLSAQDLSQDEWREVGDVLCELEKNRYHGMLRCAGDCFYRSKEFEHAVSCWEQCGDTRKYDYYVAKAEALSFPAGLQWLEKAGDHDRIITEWEKAGGLDGAIGQEWLNSVGPALEKKIRHWEACRVYMELGNTAKVLVCFAEVSKKASPSDLWEGLIRLVEYLIHQGNWTDTFDVIDKYEIAGRNAERLLLRCRVVRELAYSGVTRESIPRDQRRVYERFINRVLKLNDWRRHLSPQELGAALERIGALNTALDFYWRFVSDPKLQQFARERWILSKRRQENYFREQGKKGRAEQIRIEVSNQAYDWGIRLDRLDSLPYYPTLRLEKEKEFVDQREKFLIGHIEVILLRHEKVVLLIDTRDLTTLRVDLKEGKVTGQEVKHTTRRSGELLFDVPESGYRGTTFYGGEKASIELEIQGVAGTFSIKL